MNLNVLHPAEQLTRMIKRVYDQRLTTTSGGNLSIKDENGDMWITPASVDKGTLTKEDMVCIKSDGTIMGRHKPSSEYPFHQKIYEARKDLKAVLHAHPSGLVAFSIVRKIPETRICPQVYWECGKVGMARYAMTGSQELGDCIAEVFSQGYDVVMLENHGVVVGAENMQDAFGRFETMEAASRIQIHAAALGKLCVLDEETIQECTEALKAEREGFESGEYSSREKAARKGICDFAARAYRQQLITSVQGSFSERIDDGRFVITPYHKDRLYLEPEDIAAVENGKSEFGKRPGRAADIHRAIYEAHPEINSIIICQPQNVMAFAVTGEALDSKTIPESYIMMRDIPRLKSPVMLEKPETIADMFDESTPIVMADHDCLIVTGESMLKTFDRLEVAEYSAMSIVMSKNQGEIIPIDERGLEEIRQVFHLK